MTESSQLRGGAVAEHERLTNLRGRMVITCMGLLCTARAERKACWLEGMSYRLDLAGTGMGRLILVVIRIPEPEYYLLPSLL